MSLRGYDLMSLVTGGVLEHVSEPTAPSVSGTPTEFDTELLEDVLDIIDEMGKTVTFWVYPEADYDPTTGEGSLGEAVQYSKKVIPPYEVDLKYIYADVAQAGDMLTGIAASGLEFTPTNGIKITIDSCIWTAVRVIPIYANEMIVLYILQLRR